MIAAFQDKTREGRASMYLPYLVSTVGIPSYALHEPFLLVWPVGGIVNAHILQKNVNGAGWNKIPPSISRLGWHYQGYCEASRYQINAKEVRPMRSGLTPSSFVQTTKRLAYFYCHGRRRLLMTHLFYR